MEFEGHSIYIYQDLSAMMLRHRKDLRPLLEVLRTRGIRYRWKFPFGLLATHQGHSALLRVPEELEAFCQTIDIPYVVTNWYAKFDISDPNSRPPSEDPMEAQDTRFQRHLSPSATRLGSAAPSRLLPSSPTTAPMPCWARQDRKTTPC